jgi:SAM-dependent methyltransferase
MSELSIAVDPANIDQARAWDGDEGAYWADNAERFDRFIATHHAPFLAAAAITATDRVLDIGCGTGQATRDAARAATAGSALGVDLSTRMIDCARQAARREEPATPPSSRAMPRSTPSRSARSMSPSAAPERCSSATRSPPSPTSPARCGPAAGSAC